MLYDPATESWRPGAAMAAARDSHLATLLLSGEVLVVGGYDAVGRVAAAELYDEGRGAPVSSGPTFHARSPFPVVLGRELVLTGDFPQALRESSGGGTQSSATNHPLLHLTRAGSDAGTVLPLASFGSDIYANGTIVAPLPVSLMPGLYWARLAENGLQGAAMPLRLIANHPPVAQSRSVTLAEDVPTAVGLLANDLDGDALTFTVVTPPSHGALTGSGASLTYTPDADFNGTDSFSFVAGDGLADSSPAAVTLTVTPVNDPPSAHEGGAMSDEDSAVAITLVATDVDGDALTYAVVTPPAHGSVTVSGAVATYTPAANYSGPDGFTFRANDGAAYSAPAAVAIGVAPVNDAPVAQAQSVSTSAETPVAFTLAGTDVEGDALTYTVVTQPINGTLTGTGAALTYTPAAGFSGNDAFTFKVNDGAADSAPATVSVAVAPAVAPPSEPKGGCSCGSSGEVAPLGGLLLGLLAVRRRRRAS
jgi:MYXO-CTERM domain-containing protein